MASSIFEVTETESETEKEISFRLEACEENGIGLSAQVDEVPKDHNYTKDPDESEEDGVKAEDSQVENEKESSEKLTNKGQRSPRGGKKVIAKVTKRKRVASPKKETPSPKKGKAKKEVLTEDSNKTGDNSQIDKMNSIEESSRTTPKRGRKRKVEEKENVIDRSIMEEVQNINEGDSAADVKNELPLKRKKAIPVKPLKSKTPKKSKSTPAVKNGNNNQNIPKGWVRKEVIRKSGKSAGKTDVYYYSPDGIKFRSRPDIAAYLARTKSNLKLKDFSFARVKGVEETPVKAAPKKEKSSVVTKPKSTNEKKKVQSTPTPSKKRKSLVVKLHFSPKKGSAKKTKVALKPKRLSKGPVKKNVKASGSVSKASKKK